MIEWQPIDTAPKDGTVIIVYGDKNDRPNVQTHFYQTAAWVGNGWTNAANSWLKDVTHWIALPAPPKKGEGKVFPTVLEFYDGLPETWDEAAKLGTVTKDEFEKIAAKCFDPMLELQKEKK